MRQRDLIWIGLLLLFLMASGECDLFASLLLLAFVVYSDTKNGLYALYVGLGLLLLLTVIYRGPVFPLFERFENEASAPGALAKVEKKLAEGKTALEKATDQPPDGSKKEDEEEYTKQINTYDLAKAQKETFQMIDTVKQLRDVIESLGPTLTQGKEVLKMYEKLNIK